MVVFQLPAAVFSSSPPSSPSFEFSHPGFSSSSPDPPGPSSFSPGPPDHQQEGYDGEDDHHQEGYMMVKMIILRRVI